MSQSTTYQYESPLAHMLSIVKGEVVPTNCGPHNSIVVNQFNNDQVVIPPRMRRSFTAIQRVLYNQPGTTKQVAKAMGRKDTTYVHRLLLNMESIGMVVGTRSSPRVWST